MKRDAATWLAMANSAERKANEWAASDEPWALANLRLYQNLMSRWLGEHYRALREEAKSEIKCPTFPFATCQRCETIACTARRLEQEVCRGNSRGKAPASRLGFHEIQQPGANTPSHGAGQKGTKMLQKIIMRVPLPMMLVAAFGGGVWGAVVPDFVSVFVVSIIWGIAVGCFWALNLTP